MVWEENMSISEVSGSLILPCTWNRKLGDLGKFSFTSFNFLSFRLHHMVALSMGKIKFKINRPHSPHVSCQINKGTIYKETPIYACFFPNDVMSF